MVAIRSLVLLAALATAITASPVIQERQEQEFKGPAPDLSGVANNPQAPDTTEAQGPDLSSHGQQSSQNGTAGQAAGAQEGSDAQEAGGAQENINAGESGSTAETTDANGNTFVFRTDLQENRQGLSPRFKNLLLSTVASSSAPAGFEITFVDIAEKDKAAQGVVKSQAMPIKVLDGSTRFFTPGVDASNPSGPQPVTLEAEQQNFGQLFQLGNELRLGSTDPPFNSWIICDGAGETNHPVLKWLGAPNNVVQSQRGCDFVRLYVESPSG